MSDNATPAVVSGEALMGHPDIKKFLSEINGPLPTPVAVAAGTPIPPAPFVENTPPAATLEELAEEAIKAAEPISPQDRYLKDLEKLGVSRDEASRIVDTMLFGGVYEEEIVVTKKLKVKFRTRGQDAVDRLNQAIDKINPQFNGSLYSIVAEYNLAHSLAAYGPHAFDTKTDEAFDRVHKYVKALPSPVFQLLASKLSKFDQKLTTIMAEDVVASFF
jgi:hypothetical protein